MKSTSISIASIAATVSIGAIASNAAASPRQDDLAGYFGFDPLEVIKIDPKAGPFIATDLNGDGLLDLVAVNNHKSRLDLLYQKKDAKPTDEPPPPRGPNELPDHWRFRRENVTVGHEVRAVIPYDYDHDGLLDLVYAGNPGTIVFVRQSKPGVFETARRTPVKQLNASRDGLVIADVVADAKPELLGLVNGRISIWPLDGDMLGTPSELSAGTGNIVAILVDDFDGNGTLDIAGVIPEDPSPIRVWFTTGDGDRTVIGPQLRFEAPPLREAAAVRLPTRKGSLLGFIEKPSKRVVFGEFVRTPIDRTGDRQTAIQTWSWEDPGNRRRDYAVVDLDGDGLLDLLATNTQTNSIMAYVQRAGRGFDRAEANPSYADLNGVATFAPQGGPVQVYALSEKEGVAGRSVVESGRIPFPQAIQLPSGVTPTTMALVMAKGEPRVAIICKDGRNYTLELVPVDGSGEGRQSIPLGQLSRAPETILSLDAGEGATDLLLFTPEKPLTMARWDGNAWKVLESKDMGQFGLVQAANGQNTAVFDASGDGRTELLVADRNFVRALRYDPAPTGGQSPGWQVVEQMNAKARDAKLNSIAVMGDRIVAGDAENGKLLFFAREAASSGGETPDANAPKVWNQVDVVDVPAFKFNRMHTGHFSGDPQNNVLLIGDEGFAVVRLAGDRVKMNEVATFRSDDPRRVEHEMVSGDLNGDGLTEVVLLDAGQQMAEILTFSEAERAILANQFEVFESRLFSSGEPREFEPSMGLIKDVTGDGRNDLILLAHDRILLYPQQANPTPSAKEGDAKPDGGPPVKK
ncbi:MAG: VCBS repeat-containing protein [Phycisphaerae bacterium]|nr:VCBS repeat-containing protein [Phycisphaerae bacterium]